ncbi:N-acetylmuramoyl-L-alanine amidase [Agromyces sp. CF514]|uniref:peptidoglycan recognition protein family protein n=1 Tax=Agromyces sp. CF514 TaxID=1881031 RepID=UPI0008E2C9CD|nr:N-acetylmuramoyl-L-alanine amidase [Agromyces sp. CF514]SFR76164.1 N-acetylmuramoyl-L-alanine amidase [Agromyces sp. CF514]
MSWASTIAGSVNSPNQSPRFGRKVTGWIIHHNAATGGSYVLELMRTGKKQVSANYQVMQNGDVWGVVPRESRSWSASNSDWDASSLTFEIANDSGEPGWTISDRAYEQVAKTIAEDSRWAGIPINRTTVRGHREGSAQGDGGSYPTACPGGIDLDRLVRMAQGYVSGSVAGLDAELIQEEDEMAIQIIKEIAGVPNGEKARYGVMGSKSGFSHIQTMNEVNALLKGIGKTEKEAVRGVSRLEFDRIATALTR